MILKSLKKVSAGAAIAAMSVAGVGVASAPEAEAASCTWYYGYASHNTWYYEGSSCQQFAGKIAQAKLTGNFTAGNFATYARFGNVQSVGSTETAIFLDYYSGSRQSAKWYSPQAGSNPPKYRLQGTRGGIQSSGAMGVSPASYPALLTFLDYVQAASSHSGDLSGAADTSKTSSRRAAPTLPFLNVLDSESDVPISSIRKIYDDENSSIWYALDGKDVWLVHRSESKGETVVTKQSRADWAQRALAINIADADGTDSMTIAFANEAAAKGISDEMKNEFPEYQNLGRGLFVKRGSNPDEFARKSTADLWKSKSGGYVVGIPH